MNNNYAENEEYLNSEFNSSGIAKIAGIEIATGKKQKNDSPLRWDKPLRDIIDIETHNDKYPLEVFPSIIGGAISDIQSYMQAPTALIGASALSSISLAGQGLVDVRRDSVLSGATSLNTLVIAESGERKTAVDKLMSKPIKEQDKKASLKLESLLKDHAGKMEVWEILKKQKIAELKAALKAEKLKDDIEAIQHESAVINGDEPQLPIVQSMLYESFSSQALTDGLKNGYPSVGIFSDEGGTVFGSYAMQGDNVSGTLGLMNKLWDGSGIKHRTRGFGDVTVYDRRLTVPITVQKSIYQTFINGTDGNARGSGFNARFLIANPISTQGYRSYKEPPSMLLLDGFHSCISTLLDQPLTIQGSGGVKPVELSFQSSAKKQWVSFYNDVEAELKPLSDLADIKDFASKAGENTARISALFHLIENGSTGMISAENVERASVLMKWYLYEAKAFYAGIDVPDYVANALKLDEWLINRCKANGSNIIRRLHVTQYSPTRKKQALDDVLAILDEKGRAQEYKADDNKIYIAINPELLGGNGFA